MTTRHDPAFPSVIPYGGEHHHSTGLTKLEYAAIQIYAAARVPDAQDAVNRADFLFDVLEGK